MNPEERIVVIRQMLASVGKREIYFPGQQNLFSKFSSFDWYLSFDDFCGGWIDELEEWYYICEDSSSSIIARAWNNVVTYVLSASGTVIQANRYCEETDRVVMISPEGVDDFLVEMQRMFSQYLTTGKRRSLGLLECRTLLGSFWMGLDIGWIMVTSQTPTFLSF